LVLFKILFKSNTELNAKVNQLNLLRDRVTKSFIWLNLILSIILLGYSYYRSESVFNGELHHKYIKHYGIFLLLIFLWSFLLRRKQAHQYVFVKYFIVVVVALYAAEFAITYSLFNRVANERSEAAEAAGVLFDDRGALEVYEDLLGKGFDPVPHIQPANLIVVGETFSDRSDKIFPLGGVSLKTTISSNESGRSMIYKSDRFGFNNPNQAWDSEEFDWFLTGDSMTQGIAVQPGEDIGAQIRSLTSQSVINLGMSGNGPLIELAVINEYAASRNPHKVLWLYFEGNDLVGDFRKEKSVGILLQYLNDPSFTQNLEGRQNEIDSMLLSFIQETIASKTKKLLSNLLFLSNIRQILVHNHDHLTVDPLFRKVLKEARDRCASWGGELYFVYLPQFERYLPQVKNHDEFRKRSEVVRLVEELGIPIVDVHEELFVHLPDPKVLFPFVMRGHYSAEGYSKVAQTLADCISN
jgi:hypothetical protein